MNQNGSGVRVRVGSRVSRAVGGGVGRRGEVGHELLGEVHGLAARAGRGVHVPLSLAEHGGGRGQQGAGAVSAAA